jgi:hydrogenase maturation protease
MTSPSGKTVVLGLGNILHSDDGAGPRAAERLKSDSRLPEGVTVIEGGTLGLELLPELWDCSYLLILDAVDTGQPPGVLVRLSGEQLNKLAGSGNVHQLGVADLLVALRLLAQQLPEVVLLGIQPETVDWGNKLSPVVEAGVPRLIAAVLAELHDRRQHEVMSRRLRRKHVFSHTRKDSGI